MEGKPSKQRKDEGYVTYVIDLRSQLVNSCLLAQLRVHPMYRATTKKHIGQSAHLLIVIFNYVPETFMVRKYGLLLPSI